MAERIQELQERVWQIVNAIPPGRVATYGQIARLAGMPRQARLVGRVLSRLPAGSRLPWHRVIDARGRITSPGGERQRKLLQEEGVVILNGRVDLADCQWDAGPSAE